MEQQIKEILNKFGIIDFLITSCIPHGIYDYDIQIPESSMSIGLSNVNDLFDALTLFRSLTLPNSFVTYPIGYKYLHKIHHPLNMDLMQGKTLRIAEGTITLYYSKEVSSYLTKNSYYSLTNSSGLLCDKNGMLFHKPEDIQIYIKELP